MSTVLHIEASPLKARSHTLDAAHAFLEAYRARNPSDAITTLDLWSVTLPPFDALTIEAKFAVLRRKQFTPEQEAKWNAMRAVSQRFNAADKYVFSVPMWNFGVPYPLKHYIDVVTLAGENWTWNPRDSYQPLLSGKKALLIYSSAGHYPIDPIHPADFVKPYLRHWLSFIGITDIREINVAPTLTDPASVTRTREIAREQATVIAREF
jgi:FMN-dependent NADH-azoreductase